MHTHFPSLRGRIGRWLVGWLGLIPALQAQGQATLQTASGTFVHATAQTVLTLRDVSWQQNGTYLDTMATVRVAGTADTAAQRLASDSLLTLAVLRLDKSAGGLRLSAPLTITDSLRFGGGLLSLSASDITLQADAVLVGESEESRLLGDGQVSITQTLSAPVATDPGRLGAIFTSDANLGAVTVIRTHAPIAVGNGASIRRSYQLVPTLNEGLGTSVAFRYLDAELNGNAEAGLGVYALRPEGWEVLPVSAHDTVGNRLEVTGLDRLGTFAIGTDLCPAIATTVTTEGNTLRADEADATYHWLDCATNQPIEGATQRTFAPDQNGTYAVRVSTGGCTALSVCVPFTITRLSDGLTTSTLRAYPNPVQDRVTVELAQMGARVRVELHDAAGRLVLQRAFYGTRTFSVAMVGGPGVYVLNVRADDQPPQRVRLLKR